MVVSLDWASSRSKLVLSNAFLNRRDHEAKFLDYHMVQEDLPTGLKNQGLCSRHPAFHRV